MMKKTVHKICKIEPGSIAEELELEPGDVMLSINGAEIEDVFDYHYHLNDEYLTLLVQKENGEEWELEIEKELEEDLGLEFETGLMDEYRSCCNKCIFCFIDQMPPGMRETLYFKDDDARLSFLQGNYVTLTNMSDKDIQRIMEYHMGPINISFQTMNPKLRCQMLNNRFAGEALKKVDKLYEAGIEMNGQIVLCKGVNDGAELEYSIEKLSAYLPYLQSVSVVPVGLTKYREGLAPLQPFNKEDAVQVLAVVHKWQERLRKEHGQHFIHAGDEWYILAEQEMPEEKTYDGYLQLENGVGMTRLLLTEVKEALDESPGDDREKALTIATGVLAFPYIKELSRQVCSKYPNISVQVQEVKNHFFGERITVAGLLTGKDILAQLKGLDLGDELLIPSTMLRSGEAIFLDEVTVEEMEKALQTRVSIVKSSGQDFVRALTCENKR